MDKKNSCQVNFRSYVLNAGSVMGDRLKSFTHPTGIKRRDSDYLALKHALVPAADI